jgi:hypothetical protein
MNDLDLLAFTDLWKEACQKCFGYPPKEPLTETESKRLYNHVFEQTGLTIGWKSLKNYSLFVFADPPGKEENPSVATLDTLSRYIMDAPYTTEPERKKTEGHYPYWYRYREGVLRKPDGHPRQGGGRRGWIFLGASLLLGLLIVGLTLVFRSGVPYRFADDFHSVGEDSLAGRGWWAKAEEGEYWKRRGEHAGGITLFTLKGDNWPDPAQTPVIHNLLLRKIPCDCFTMELHLKDFLPRQNWQQAGILLLEDTGFAGKSLRVSIAYNDYMGGNPLSRWVLVQAITSLGNGFSKPEEIAHFPLFNVDSLDKNPVLSGNLAHPALRIEKKGDQFRLLYADGVSENTSFKEVVSREFAMTPRYAGLFALKGFVDSAANIPVLFTFFSLNCDRCGAR